MSDKTLEWLDTIRRALPSHGTRSEDAINAHDCLRAELSRLQTKCNNSLANNLCPDHRDKQAGKPCLACEIESLQANLDAAIGPGNRRDEKIASLQADLAFAQKADMPR